MRKLSENNQTQAAQTTETLKSTPISNTSTESSTRDQELKVRLKEQEVRIKELEAYKQDIETRKLKDQLFLNEDLLPLLKIESQNNSLILRLVLNMLMGLRLINWLLIVLIIFMLVKTGPTKKMEFKAVLTGLTL